ncbi:MAG: hypothetical protein VX589_09735 [Myxococcota bacterium]|nr:hypothetical protein [Myxococcota bacterium]
MSGIGSTRFVEVRAAMPEAASAKPVDAGRTTAHKSLLHGASIESAPSVHLLDRSTWHTQRPPTNRRMGERDAPKRLSVCTGLTWCELGQRIRWLLDRSMSPWGIAAEHDWHEVGGW